MSTAEWIEVGKSLDHMIRQVETHVLEEGMNDEVAEVIAEGLRMAKEHQADGQRWEAEFKRIWLDAYLRGECEKTVEINGIRLQCQDAGAPKEVVTEAHYVPNLDLLMETYPPHLAPDIWTHVPKSTETKAGAIANVSVTLPKGK